jgi:thiol:disulfide interchange protein DsbC
VRQSGTPAGPPWSDQPSRDTWNVDDPARRLPDDCPGPPHPRPAGPAHGRPAVRRRQPVGLRAGAGWTCTRVDRGGDLLARRAEVADGTPDARARDAIRALNSQVKIDRIGPAPVPGFREVVVGGQVVYVTDDGKFLMQGTLIDVASKESMGEGAMATLRRELLATVPDEDKIVFAPASPAHTVTVFTDVECGYCRRFHESIAEYNRQGIAVEYLAFPRMGPGSEDFEKMVSVWCAADRRRAMTDAKADRPVPDKDCNNPVAMHYSLGQRAGLTGTPMILGEDGRQLGGYVPPDELRAALDERYGGDVPATPEPAAATAGAGAP